MSHCTCEHAFDCECFKGDGKMTDLDRLIESVEGGVQLPMDGSAYRLFGDGWLHVFDAYHGSLDAAKALHDVLLPEWVGYADTTGFCFLYEDENEANESSSLCIGNPARAWLLTVLKAYRSQQ